MSDRYRQAAEVTSGDKIRPAAERPVLLYVVNLDWAFISHRLHLAVAAERAGYEVHVAAEATSMPDVQQIISRGFRFHEIAFDRGSRDLRSHLRAIWQLFMLYRKIRPAIVHHVTVKPVLFGTLAARLSRVPHIVNAISGMGYLFSNEARARSASSRLVLAAYRMLFATSRVRVIFQNRDDLNFFIDQRLISTARAVLIRGAGVELEKFRPSEVEPSEIAVVLPARMVWDKGVLEFRAAAQQLKAEGVAASFKLAGGLDPASATAVPVAWLTSAVDSGDVSWLGHCADMAQLLQDTQIVCLPTTYREGLPKSLLEAAASGCAIVTTDAPGCREIVRHEITGLLVSANDAKALADALRTLITDRELRRRLGLAARQYVEAEFSDARVQSDTLNLYAAMLARR